jgi:hypothetical protein
MRTKPSVMLADLIDHEVTDEEADDILYNVAEYKKLCL